MGNTNLTNITAVCPKCHKQSPHFINEWNETHFLKCDFCKTDFKSIIVKVRTKNATSNKNEQKQLYSVRVFRANGKEDLIQFETSYRKLVEMKQKDIIMLSYLKNQLHIVENFTINNYTVIRNKGCLGSTLLAVLLFLLVVINTFR